MERDNYIYSYYQKIKDGSETVGRWIRLLYEYIIQGLEKKAFYFDKKKADDAIEYFSTKTFHVEGELAPAPIKLELWQKAFFSMIYGIVDEAGRRQFAEILLLIGRKNGKSLMGCQMGKYEWEKNGGFGAKIYNIAPKLDQADIIYNGVWTMMQLDPDYIERKAKLEKAKKRKEFGDDPELPRHRMTDLYIPATNATFKKIAFSAKKSDGFNPSLGICDENAA